MILDWPWPFPEVVGGWSFRFSAKKVLPAMAIPHSPTKLSEQKVPLSTMQHFSSQLS
jgi:hypothetical protein